MTKLNHNRPSSKALDVWVKHDQYLPPWQRADDQRERSQKPSRWLLQLRAYDGPDAYLAHLAARDARGESIENERQKAAGKLGWYLNQHDKAVSALVDVETSGDLSPRGRELLDKVDRGDDLTGKEVREVEQMTKSAA